MDDMTFRDTDLVILAARNEDDVSHLEVRQTVSSARSGISFHPARQIDDSAVHVCAQCMAHPLICYCARLCAHTFQTLCEQLSELVQVLPTCWHAGVGVRRGRRGD